MMTSPVRRLLGMRGVEVSDEAVSIFPRSPRPSTAVVVPTQVSQRADPSSDGAA